MKRTLPMLILLIIELFLAVVLQFRYSPYLLGALFFFNLLFYLLLLVEPYWRIGAVLSFMIFLMVSLHVLNLFIFGIMTTITSIITMIAVFLGILLVLLAHRLKQIEFQEMPEAAPQVNPAPKKQEPKKTKKEPKKLQTQIYVMVEENEEVHLAGCEKLDEIDDKKKVVIGSKRYAQSRNLKECKECRPYST